MHQDETRLTTADLYLAAQAGILRRISAIKSNRHQRHGNRETALWDQDIEGCIAEMLVAKAFNINWTPYADDPKSLKSDVGEDIQVRSTKRSDGCLLVHPDDPDEQMFVLVTGTGLDKTIKGYIKGSYAKKPKYWRTSTGRPCYFVPQSDLCVK